MNIKRYLVSNAKRRQYTPFFKFKSTDINLLSGLVCLSDKMAGYDWSVLLSLKPPGEGSVVFV